MIKLVKWGGFGDHHRGIGGISKKQSNLIVANYTNPENHKITVAYFKSDKSWVVENAEMGGKNRGNHFKMSKKAGDNLIYRKTSRKCWRSG